MRRKEEEEEKRMTGRNRVTDGHNDKIEKERKMRKKPQSRARLFNVQLEKNN